MRMAWESETLKTQAGKISMDDVRSIEWIADDKWLVCYLDTTGAARLTRTSFNDLGQCSFYIGTTPVSREARIAYSVQSDHRFHVIVNGRERLFSFHAKPLLALAINS
jgi:hypothetical protein